MDAMPKSTEKQTARNDSLPLHKLQEKDPEFYEFLKEHDKELLEFDDEQTDGEEMEADGEAMDDDNDEDDDDASIDEQGGRSLEGAITSEMVDSWCNSIREKKKHRSNSLYGESISFCLPLWR